MSGLQYPGRKEKKVKESYIKDRYINSVGLEVLVMGIREMSAEEEAKYIADLKAKATEFFDDGSFYIEDDSEWGICMACKDHACPVTHYDADGEEQETGSNCCGASLWLP